MRNEECEFWGVTFDPFSEKVTCTQINLRNESKMSHFTETV